MLESSYAHYKKKAEEINWKKYNQNELFFEYIKHENDELGDKFFAGIVCRFWGYAGRIYVQCNRHVPFEYCHDCIIDAIRYVIDKRVWENPDNSLYNDPTGPDKAMHIAMKRQRAIMLTKFNAKKRKSNFNVLSIDEAHEEYSDSADGLLFGSEYSNEDYMRTYISEYFDKGEYLSGLLLDCICYNNDSNEFKPTNIIRFLKGLNKEYYSYYYENYELDEEDFKKCVYEIKNSSNNYLRIKLNSLLYKLRKEGSFSA